MEGKFLSPCRLEVAQDSGARPEFVLTDPLHYHDAEIGTVIVPAGYLTDLCSVPQIAMSIVGYPGARAGVVHDYLITSGLVRRDLADQVFYRALLACGVNDTTAGLMYAAVSSYTASLQQAATDDPYKAGA